MKVYQRDSAITATPYENNCYIATDKESVEDIEVFEPRAYFTFYRIGIIDYLQFRDYCKTVFIPIWETLPTTDKSFLTSHSVRPSGEPMLSFNGYQNVVDLEHTARENRWCDALSVGGYFYFDNDAYKLAMYQDAKPFRSDYIEANLPFIILWLQSASNPALGVDFTATGFASKPYYNETLKNQLLSCFVK